MTPTLLSSGVVPVGGFLKPFTAPFLILFLGAHAGLLQAAGPQVVSPNVKPAYTALDVSQRNQIQAIGRGLLAAMGNQQASAEELALLESLHGLAGSIEQALQAPQPTLNPKIDPNNTAPEASASEAPKSPRRAQLDRQLRPYIERLRQHRQQIEVLSAGDDDTQKKIARVQGLVRHAGALQQSLDEALSVEDDADRFARLTDLKQRLRSRSLDEWRQQQKDEALQNRASVPETDTPTLTTLIQHRTGLDDLRTRKHD